jgi:hypothetical protein
MVIPSAEAGAAMNESDARFLRDLEAGLIANAEFGHRDHLRAAWAYLQQEGFPNAIAVMERTIRRFAAHHGHERKFHVTLTVAWVNLVAAHAACHRDTAFEDFIAANGELLDKNLTLRFYSRERLFSDAARTRWIEPDVRSLPRIQ